MTEEPIEAVIARLREALDINEHGNGIVGFNTFAEVNGSDLSRLLDYVEGMRAPLDAPPVTGEKG